MSVQHYVLMSVTEEDQTYSIMYHYVLMSTVTEEDQCA
jgi:hypothetical protein